MGKKTVYTDKISMSGRSEYGVDQYKICGHGQ